MSTSFPNVLHRVSGGYGPKLLMLLAQSRFSRKYILSFAREQIYSGISSDENVTEGIRRDKRDMGSAFLNSMERAYERAEHAPAVRKAIITALAHNIFLKKRDANDQFLEMYGRRPPGFVTISPGKFCNLKCTGCYAGSSSACAERLDWNVLNRIVEEKTKLWDSYFTVISGGEPFLYRSRGKGILDLARRHPDNYFLVYTNGTLIDQGMAARLAELGNIAPAISVEGFEAETDGRRGKGVHRRVISAMERLRAAGVPFGLSFTATAKNADAVLDEEFYRYYIDELGALFIWVFQLMPIGRASVDLMVSPEQRVRMFKKTRSMVRDRGVFIADFWNSGCAVNGCISAGRDGGYLYIDWNGNVTPCVFNPYSPVNINDVYARGGTLNDAVNEPFFESIRKWQKTYGFKQSPSKIKNWIAPCAIKDHYGMMRKLIAEHHPRPIDEAAADALEDKAYASAMKAYGKEVQRKTDPIWEEEYKAGAKESL